MDLTYGFLTYFALNSSRTPFLILLSRANVRMALTTDRQNDIYTDEMRTVEFFRTAARNEAVCIHAVPALTSDRYAFNFQYVRGPFVAIANNEIPSRQSAVITSRLKSDRFH